MNLSRCIASSLFGIVLLLSLARPAYAYADPGSGLLMVQIGGSMLAGLVLYLRIRLRPLFRSRSRAKGGALDRA